MGGHLATQLAVLRHTTEWMLQHGAQDPNDALAGSSPYLRMFGLVLGGWLLCRGGLAAANLLKAGGTAGTFSTEFLEAKIVTARFYATQLLPQASGLASAATAGCADLFAIDAKHLAS